MTGVLRFVRRFATAPGFRLLKRVGPLLRVSFALRATLVRTPLQFASSELRPGARTGIYELRNAPIRVALRHHTADVLMLDEIFSQREYDLPEAVRSNLAERDHLTVADLGANIGLFGAFILTEYPEARITAIEADPANAAVHARTIEANRRQETWRLVTAFASTAVGMTRFAAGNFGLSRATEEDTGIEVPTLDAFPLIQGVDLVKIDVEGAEWRLLADRRFRELSASAVVLEYHRENCPGTDPAAEAERALRGCGLDVARGASKPQFGAGVLWGWRR